MYSRNNVSLFNICAKTIIVARGKVVNVVLEIAKRKSSKVKKSALPYFRRRADYSVKVFTFNTTMLQEYAGKWDTKMFTLTFADTTGITNLECTASVTCNGVTVEA